MIPDTFRAGVACPKRIGGKKNPGINRGFAKVFDRNYRASAIA